MRDLKSYPMNDHTLELFADDSRGEDPAWTVESYEPLSSAYQGELVGVCSPPSRPTSG